MFRPLGYSCGSWNDTKTAKHSHLFMKNWLSDNNFAICFLLEIPLRGFPFQMKFVETYIILNNNTNS